MTSSLLNLIAIIFYLITWVLISKSVRHNINNPDQQSSPNKLYLVLWGVALLMHLFTLAKPLGDQNQFDFGFITLSSYIMWFISLILFISSLSRKIQALAVLVLPLTIISILMLFTIDSDADKTIQMNSGLGLHILSSLLAYSTLMLAAVQAVLLALQNNYLHKGLHNALNNPKQSRFMRTLPALEDMEHFLFNLLGIGVLLLSIGLISGFFYLENLFGSEIAHKTILSIISWFIFSALLIGRWKFGWRGKTAIRWTLVGFLVLALAFFGSKFLQEFVIKKEHAGFESIPKNTLVMLVKKTPPTFSPVFQTTLKGECS